MGVDRLTGKDGHGLSLQGVLRAHTQPASALLVWGNLPWCGNHLAVWYEKPLCNQAAITLPGAPVQGSLPAARSAPLRHATGMTASLSPCRSFAVEAFVRRTNGHASPCNAEIGKPELFRFLSEDFLCRSRVEHDRCASGTTQHAERPAWMPDWAPASGMKQPRLLIELQVTERAWPRQRRAARKRPLRKRGSAPASVPPPPLPSPCGGRSLPPGPCRSCPRRSSGTAGG